MLRNNADARRSHISSLGYLWCYGLLLNKYLTLITSAEREVKDSRRSGMFQSCIRKSRSCFGISSRSLRVLSFILQGERNNYEEEIIIISGLPRIIDPGSRVTRQNRKERFPAVSNKALSSIWSLKRKNYRLTLLVVHVGSLEKRSNQLKY